MKYLQISFLLVCLNLSAQKAEKIHPNARNQKSVAYLTEQSALWKSETEKNPKNTEAWYNYYYANRNLGFNDKARSSEEKQKVINNLLIEMEKAIPDSYEYHLCRWMNGGWDMKLISHLERAQQLGPDRPELIDYSIILSEMKGDTKARDMWAKKKKDAGQFSNGLIYYNYNVLAGLPENCILITSGDNDTFPIYYLQSLGIRRDVTIVHAYLVNVDEYRKPVFKSLGIPEWSKATSDQSKDLVAQLAKNEKGLPVHLGLTSPHCIKETTTDHLYLTGLSYLYSSKPIDNVAWLKKNFEQHFALDYLDKAFFDEISPDIVQAVNGNYIVPMLKLFEHYRISGDQQKAEWIKGKLMSIAAGTKHEEDVKKQVSRT